MYVMDFSLDNLSMMALILCVGFVVDDAIVMLENIVRHMEMGSSPMQAAFEGSREIGFTIISMTLSLAAVFIPVLFMGGILGRLFKEFAVSICAAILISGFVSVTLTPMLCSRFLRVRDSAERGALYRVTERFFDGMLRFYDRSLQAVLRHRPAVMWSSSPSWRPPVGCSSKFPKASFRTRTTTRSSWSPKPPKAPPSSK
jgi:HAE1 family hydrophobic/amphiphilic exporter-1